MKAWLANHDQRCKPLARLSPARCGRKILASCFLMVSVGLSAAQTPESFVTPEFEANWSLGVIGAQHAYALGFTGAGIKLGIADGAYQFTHPEFAGRIIYPSVFPLFPIPGFKVPEHGTHVMGLAAAARNNEGMMGVAFNALLAGVIAVGDEEGYPSPGDWVGQLIEAGVTVMNGSFGPDALPPPFFPDESPNPNYAYVPFQAVFAQSVTQDYNAIKRLSAEDILMVFAAGNDFLSQPEPSETASGFAIIPLIFSSITQTLQRDCLDKKLVSDALYCFLDPTAVGFDPYNPSTWDGAFLSLEQLPEFDGRPLAGSFITVVATDRDNKIANFSNRCGDAADWCIAAPGVALLSSVPMSAYKEETGTSMASPVVAGAAAVLREAFPYMTARQIIEVILTNADSSVGAPEVYGHGLLDLASAIKGPKVFGKPSLLPGRDAIFPTIFAVDTQGYDSVWSNNITGAGGFSKAGEGMLTLTGHNDYDGDTTVTGGELRVNGVIEHSDLFIEAGGTLSGTGTVANTLIRGTLSPGNSVGTLTVDGDLILADGSIFLFEIDAEQNADLVIVSGLTKIESGAVFKLAPEGWVDLDFAYPIFRSDRLDGSFTSLHTNYTFIDLNFVTEGSNLSLVIERNAVPMQSYAQSNNQRAVARAIDSQSPGDEPFNVVLLNDNPSQLPGWFQDWSGEIYATNQAVVLGTTRLVSQRLGWRLQDLGAPTRSTRQIGMTAEDGASPWADIYGNWQQLSASADAASARGESANVLFGVDRAVGGQFRLGGAFGVSQLNTKVVNSRASTTAQHLALYGGGAWSGLELAAGVVQSWYDVQVSRALRSLPDGDNAPSSGSLNGNSTALFAELGVPLVVGQTTRVTPFLQVNQTWLRFGGFQESGGAAPLRGQSSQAATGFGTLGVRTQMGWQTKALEGHVSAMAGWQRGWGDLSPSTTLAFATGNPFVVNSAPLAKNALALELGVSVRMGPGSELSLVYAGAFGDGNTSQSVQAQLQWRF